eukprot:3010353-Alexandrium_andersonii.AAC.1
MRALRRFGAPALTRPQRQGQPGRGRTLRHRRVPGPRYALQRRRARVHLVSGQLRQPHRVPGPPQAPH